MNLCSRGHAEIVYHGCECPACKFLWTLDVLNTQITNDVEEIQLLREFQTMVRNQAAKHFRSMQPEWGRFEKWLDEQEKGGPK